MAHSGSDRNWKGMFIATLVILAVLGLILLSVIWMTPPEDLTPMGDKISFGDFLSNNLSGGLFNGTWISGETFFPSGAACHRGSIYASDPARLVSILGVLKNLFTCC